jgi:hypothetical protein
VDSGIFFGPGNPNNWKRDLQAMKGDDTSTAAEVASVSFKAYAQLHAKFWKDESLLQLPWVRGSDWVQGKSKESWQGTQGFVQKSWNDKAKSLWKWDPLVLEIVDHAIAGISWEKQLERLNVQGHWTLVHGDCWPGNVMWNGKNKSVKLIDFEMIGIGSNAQELGQYVISNMDPKERKACEGQIVREYYDELIRLGVKDYSFEECWREYQIGGVERWIWFLVYFAGSGNASWGEFFHNQIAAFVHDHNLTAADFTQPRV